MKRAGRLHAPEVEAIVGTLVGAPTEGVIALRAPSPGGFVPAIAAGDLIGPGGVLGALSVLGRVLTVVVPPSAASGIAVHVATTSSIAVGYGDTLATIDPALQRGGLASTTATTAATDVSGLVFRAPTSGRFYSRSSPDKPPFIAAGAQLGPGATICLLEVMKTFHRVTYGGPGLPESARVARVLVNDGDDVNAGDPLLALE